MFKTIWRKTFCAKSRPACNCCTTVSPGKISPADSKSLNRALKSQTSELSQKNKKQKKTIKTNYIDDCGVYSSTHVGRGCVYPSVHLGRGCVYPSMHLSRGCGYPSMHQGGMWMGGRGVGAVHSP